LVKKNIKSNELQAFLTGGSSFDMSNPKPFKWIPDTSWINILQISKLSIFVDLISILTGNEKGWQQWYESPRPEEESLPEPYDKLNNFKKLILIRFV
jgi:dynein heavy chain